VAKVEKNGVVDITSLEENLNHFPDIETVVNVLNSVGLCKQQMSVTVSGIVS